MKRSLHVKTMALVSSFALVTSCGSSQDEETVIAKAPKVEITGIDDSSRTVFFQADQDGVTYECKVEGGSNSPGVWQECSASGLVVEASERAQMVSVRAKRDGQISAVATKLVQASSKQGGEDKPRSIQVVIDNKGNPNAFDPNAAELEITFGVTGATLSEVRFECKVGDEGAYEACRSPLRVQRLLSGVIPSVTIRPILLEDGSVGLEDTIAFNENQMPYQDLTVEIPLGGQFALNVPAGKHVTEYASVANANGALDAYRIRTESNPYYIGNTQCADDWSQDFYALSPAGKPLRYCNTTAPQQVQDFTNEGRWANNHLMISTDPDRIAQNPYENEHIILNLFDPTSPYKREKTRFWDLCVNAFGGRVDMIPMLPMTLNFWGYPVEVNFWQCSAYMNVRQPNGFPRAELFKIGTFSIRNSIITNYHLEAVYVARANGENNAEPELFAQHAMRKFQQVLRPLNVR